MHSKKDFVESAVVIVIAFAGMVCACYYHFHENGFFLGFIGFAIATYWIVVMTRDNIKEYKQRKRQNRYRDNNAEVEMS